MSGATRRAKRAGKISKRKAARQEYVANRELGPCYIKGCGSNGDFKEACRFCDFEVQSCTLHHPMGRQKAKQHLFLRHPVKTVPTVIMGAIRGQSLE
jgi:hypothetical protein